MNTNYSKIALLLALGVIAGDKVGAKITVDYMEGAQFNSDSRKSVVKNQFADTLKKMHDRSKSDQLSEALRDIQKTHYSKNNLAVPFFNFLEKKLGTLFFQKKKNKFKFF